MRHTVRNQGERSSVTLDLVFTKTKSNAIYKKNYNIKSETIMSDGFKVVHISYISEPYHT